METQRLRLRPLGLADLEDCIAMDLDPAVRRYLMPRDPPDRESHRADWLARFERGWPDRGALWSLAWTECPGFLGWSGLFPLEGGDEIELGYRLVPAAWGRGVATEASRAVLREGFMEFEIDPIVAVAHPGNRASLRVLEKLGFRREGMARHYGQDLVYHRLTRANWEAGALD